MLVTDLVKSFINKEYYDFKRPDVTLYNFHPQILFINACQGIFFKNRDSRLRFIWPLMSVAMTMVGVILEVLFVIKSLTIDKDYSFATESFCYLVLLGSVTCIYFGTLRNNKEIIGLITNMNEDFVFITGLGPHYRNPFLERQLMIWKACYAWVAFSVLTASFFAFYPLMVMLYRATFKRHVTHDIRPLVFPIWLPNDDPYRTPNYEMFLCLEMAYCLVFLKGFCGYVYILFHYLLHYDVFMDMIILDIEVLFEGLDESVVKLSPKDRRRRKVKRILQKRIGRIVTWHVSTLEALSTISSVLGPPLVYQVMFSSIAICLMAYQITKKYGEGTFDLLFTLLVIGSVLQVWIPCYLGTVLRNKGFSIAEACWNSGWHETRLGQLVRSDLLIILARAQIPIYIKFTGLPNIQLETFSSLMSTSYSYFNMLQTV